MVGFQQCLAQAHTSFTDQPLLYRAGQDICVQGHEASRLWICESGLMVGSLLCLNMLGICKAWPSCSKCLEYDKVVPTTGTPQNLAIKEQ